MNIRITDEAKKQLCHRLERRQKIIRIRGTMTLKLVVYSLMST